MPAEKNIKVKKSEFALPVTVIGPADINRLVRELEALNDFLAQASARSPTKAAELPLLSHSMDSLSKQNNINLLQGDGRNKLHSELVKLKKEVPVINISFAAEPPAAFLEKLISWMRREIHPRLLVRTGLQPSIAAGCIVRTPSRSFDLSLKANFASTSNRAILIDKIRGRA